MHQTRWVVSTLRNPAINRMHLPGLADDPGGNMAEAVLYQLQCSVLVLKPPGFVSPVTLD